MMFCVRLLSELIILVSAHHVANHLTCCNHLSCNLILNTWKCKYQKYQKMQINNQLSIDIWEMVLYLQGKYGLACKKKNNFFKYQLKTKNINSLMTWFWCSKQNRHFWNVFMIKRLKYFNDSLNVVVILAPGRKFFSSEYVQFPLTFTEWK